MTGEVKSLLALVSEENAVCSRREKEHANRKALSRHRSTQGLFNQAARKKVGSTRVSMGGDGLKWSGSPSPGLSA